MKIIDFCSQDDEATTSMKMFFDLPGHYKLPYQCECEKGATASPFPVNHRGE
jgi:hypothetical protein